MRSSVKSLLAAAAAMGAVVSAHATPSVYQGQGASASAYVSHGGVEAWMYGWSTIGGETGTLCAEVFHQASSRTDFGCGDATVAVDPALGSARLKGTIPSEVYDTTTWTKLGDSTITVDVTLDGTGTPVAGSGADYWLSTPQPGGTPSVFGDAGESLSRQAVAAGSATSSSMCTLGSAANGVRPKKRSARHREPCVSGTGEFSGADGYLEEDAFAFVSTDDGCGDDVAVVRAFAAHEAPPRMSRGC